MRNVGFRDNSSYGDYGIVTGGLTDIKQSSHEERNEQLCVHCVFKCLGPSLPPSFNLHLSQICAYVGIGYSSPTLSSAMMELTPAFTFILAIIARMEKLELKVRSSQAKLIGTIVSITGAFSFTFYKGPAITFFSSVSTLQQHEPLLSLQSNWIFGGLLLATCSFLLAILLIVQAIFLVILRNVVQMWASGKKGPLFVTMFKPLELVIAVAMGVTFLGDTLHIGSVIGAVIIAFGFYSVMWGKAEEEKTIDYNGTYAFNSSSDNRVPLLQNRSTDI